MKMLPRQGSAGKDGGSEAALSAGAIVVYENEGAPLIAAVLAFKKDKYNLINERGREVQMAPVRLHLLPGRLPAGASGQQEKVGFLTDLRRQAEEESASINLEELWGVVCENPREYENQELGELYFSDNTLVHHLALRLALLRDPTFFKRSKHAFAPRPEPVIAELKKAEAAKQEKLRIQELTISVFQECLSTRAAQLPAEASGNVRLLEEFAAGVELDLARQKEAKELLDLAIEKLGLYLTGSKEQQAFTLLEKLGHFTPDTNLSIIRQRPPLCFGAAALEEAQNIRVPRDLSECTEANKGRRVDLTHLPCITIDDYSTKDMDDALSIERHAGGLRLGIHVSDVSSLIPTCGAVDLEARQRGTSMYLPDRIINMLPEVVSQDKLSLVLGEARPSISCLFDVDREFGVSGGQIVPSLIRVQKRYAYEEIDALLESECGDLGVLYNIAVRNEEKRLQQGALKVFKHDLQIKVDENGGVEISEFDEHGPARSLVGELMIMANALMAEYAAKHGLAVVYRLQEPPAEPAAEAPVGPAKDYALRASLKRSTISFFPGRHSALALDAYIQATSPIRRYVDLCNQRQILEHLLSGRPLYSLEEFEKIVQEVEEPLMRAGLVVKETRRYWLLKYLEQRRRRKSPADPRADIIRGTVLRVDLKNPLVELDEVFIPAIVKVAAVLKPGDAIDLKIAAVDPHYDYLKLEKI